MGLHQSLYKKPGERRNAAPGNMERVITIGKRSGQDEGPRGKCNPLLPDRYPIDTLAQNHKTNLYPYIVYTTRSSATPQPWAFNQHARLSRLAQVRTSVRADFTVASSMPSFRITYQRSRPKTGMDWMVTLRTGPALTCS